MLKITIDANVFISALLIKGNPSVILDLLLKDQFAFYYPKQLIAELQQVPIKRKLKERIKQHEIGALIQSIAERGTLIELMHVPKICRDPDDDVYLACVEVADCDYLISGDPDLLDLREHGRTKIVSPADFLKILLSF